MLITWYGLNCFKINNQGGHLTILTDPFDKKTGLTPPRIKADVITYSCCKNTCNLNSFSENSFVIDSPGEYELKGIKILGIESFCDQTKGEENGLNTIYVIEVDKIKICHLGKLGQKKLFENQIEKIGQIDILMIPVGGEFLKAENATEIIHQIEPKIILPMNYALPKLKIKLDPVDKFLKEMGFEKPKPINKLTLKKKDLEKQTDPNIFIFQI